MEPLGRFCHRAQDRRPQGGEFGPHGVIGLPGGPDDLVRNVVSSFIAVFTTQLYYCTIVANLV